MLCTVSCSFAHTSLLRVEAAVSSKMLVSTKWHIITFQNIIMLQFLCLTLRKFCGLSSDFIIPVVAILPLLKENVRNHFFVFCVVEVESIALERYTYITPFFLVMYVCNLFWTYRYVEKSAEIFDSSSPDPASNFNVEM